VTATPIPSSPSPTSATSPTANAALPDFAPTNGALIEGGSVLRVTISNRSSAAFNGNLVVAVFEVPAEAPQLAFNVRIPANGSTTVDFRLSPAVTQQSRARVRIDPTNAIPETTKDNNEATFVLAPPVQAPSLGVTATLEGNVVKVTILNNGADITNGNAVVREQHTVGGVNQTSEKTLTLNLTKNAATTLDLPKPTGPTRATITVVLNGQPIAETAVDVPAP
jgi:hypothetical protein